MEILVKRTTFSPLSTISVITINGVNRGFVLEDTDRGLNKLMTLDQIKLIKIHSKTAIPAGRYEVVISFSNKYQRKLPLLVNVPGYEGIRIHSGNFPADTEGCLLPGRKMDKDAVLESRAAFQDIFSLITNATNREKVFITIDRDEVAFQKFRAAQAAVLA